MHGFGGVDFVTVQGGQVVATDGVSALGGQGYAFKYTARAGQGSPVATPAAGTTKL